MPESFSNSEDRSKISSLNVIIFILAFLIFEGNPIQAQDVHFSQFMTTPLANNPANTGVSDDNLRIANNYRNQWAQIGVPFNTYYISIDKKILEGNRVFGIGFFLIHDQSSGLNLSAEKFFVSLSFSKFYDNQQFVFGLQPGFVYKSYNSNNITYANQFDGERFDPNLPSGEINMNNNTGYFDINAGVLWRTEVRTLKPSAGFSINHLNMPVESFDGEKSRLKFKYIFQSNLMIPLVKKFDITPCLFFGYTPGAKELLFGGTGGYNPENFFLKVKRLYVINLYRINPSRNIDAMIIGGGMKFSKIDIGITYDINVSSLYQATNFRGAFEISLVYTGGKAKSKSIEPCIVY